MAEMLGPLRTQRRLHHAAGELAQQPTRPGDVIGLKALQGVLERLGRQQLGEPVDRRLRRTLRLLGALRRISLRIRDGLDGHWCPSRPQGPNRSPRPHTLHRTEPLGALLAEAGLSFQRSRTWKASPDPDYEATAARVLALCAAAPRAGVVIS